MQILPVLDLLRGQVVRGIAGQRQEYRPIRSQLTNSSVPIDVAKAFRDTFGLNRLYVADLDAIEGHSPQISIWSELAANGFDVEIDAGLRSVDDLNTAMESGADSVILGSESLPSADLLADSLDVLKAERLVFSLDLIAGEPRTVVDDWAGLSPIEIVDCVVSMGVVRLIVLDVRRVGMGSGTGTDTLCQSIRKRFPRIELTTGGGVKSNADIRQQAAIGIDRLLVASALHDGSFTKGEEFGSRSGNWENPGAY
ncbi:HisA/HisF-related TIM barrel protein [Thalassoroseus pseudoceratinae]|uniref:HisA/HisF-related TIM barrel protein n=1 Tax=Thalassoroseus pseudoceratinae TaxID=2713176 RepID=UPI00141ED914|nr:HisA/HisF-related TIM barrel protein [Thalassoroseus pseudoceratinae]